MRRTLNTLAMLVILALAFAPLLAGPRDQLDKPLRYNPVSLDGALTTLQVGTATWSAWAYRSGAEYDIAVSFQRDGERFWSEPTFLGRADGRDQVQPALAADAAGNLYLAFVDRGVGAIRLTVLPAGADPSRGWAPAFSLTSAGQRGDMPALHVTGGSLIVAFRSGREVLIRELALLPGGSRGRGIHEGPDPWSYENDGNDGGIPGQSGGGEEEDDGGGDGGDNSGNSWGGRRGW